MASAQSLTDFGLLLRDISAMEGCEHTKRRILDRLARDAGRRIRISARLLERHKRIVTLRAMLRSGMTIPEACSVIRLRWGISRTAAWRLVRDVI
jgi:hypothetical protein